MSCPDGYSKFNRIRVIDACEKYIKDREDRIERKQEDLIQEEMRGISLFGRTWFAKTREQAIKSLASGDCWSDYNCVYINGSLSSARVEDILTMVKTSEEESVFLSEEIIRYIAKFMA